MKRIFRPLIPALIALAGGDALASGLDQMKEFLVETHTARGTFVQTVEGRNGKKPVQSAGDFAFERPGKFRWIYQKPFAQTMISDGKTLWSYEPDLNQLTIKKITNSLGASPAGLLAGASLEKYFDLRDAGTVDGIDAVDATPHGEEAIFQRVRIGISGKLPVYMEIYDNFGQTTYLRFTHFERNPGLPAGSFSFTAPKGTEVIKE